MQRICGNFTRLACVCAVNVTVVGRTYSLYSHVHAHYGMNDAFDRSVMLLLRRQRRRAQEAGGSAAGTASPAAAGALYAPDLVPSSERDRAARLQATAQLDLDDFSSSRTQGQAHLRNHSTDAQLTVRL